MSSTERALNYGELTLDPTKDDLLLTAPLPSHEIRNECFALKLGLKLIRQEIAAGDIQAVLDVVGMLESSAEKILDSAYSDDAIHDGEARQQS